MGNLAHGHDPTVSLDKTETAVAFGKINFAGHVSSAAAPQKDVAIA